MRSPKCECKIGFGKYENEGPETWLLHQHVMNEGATDEIPSEDGGPYFALVKGPLEVHEADAMAALEAGFCLDCIAKGKVEIEAAELGILKISEQGFVTSIFGMEEDLKPNWEDLLVVHDGAERDPDAGWPGEGEPLEDDDDDEDE